MLSLQQDVFRGVYYALFYLGLVYIMPKITFIDASGADFVVDADEGENLMSVAIKNGIDGISGECGGGCACATCHCFIDDAWSDKVDVAEDMEKLMLDHTASERKETSRLACQVFVTDEHEGLVVHLPEFQ